MNCVNEHLINSINKITPLPKLKPGMRQEARFKRLTQAQAEVLFNLKKFGELIKKASRLEVRILRSTENRLELSLIEKNPLYKINTFSLDYLGEGERELSCVCFGNLGENRVLFHRIKILQESPFIGKGLGVDWYQNYLRPYLIKQKFKEVVSSPGGDRARHFLEKMGWKLLEQDLYFYRQEGKGRVRATLDKKLALECHFFSSFKAQGEVYIERFEENSL